MTPFLWTPTNCNQGDVKDYPYDIYFKGFQSNNLYSKAVIADWDCCLLSEPGRIWNGITGDSFTVDGTTYNQPSWPVDGHFVLESSQCVFAAKVISGTGWYTDFVGDLYSASLFTKNTFGGNVQSDTVKWVTPDPGCCNSTGEYVFIVLYDKVGELPEGSPWPY
jgi:hypothetical protein